MYKLDQSRLRRVYYIGSLLFIVIAATFLSIPIYLNIRSEYQRKLDQLKESILDQKRLLIKSAVDEKIGDISELENILRRLGSYESEEEFDALFRKSVRELVHNTVLPDEGYIWINEIIDYSGGDRYAIRLVHPNLPETEGDYLSTKTEDIRGNKPYLEELRGIKESGEVYQDYFFKKMGSDVIAHKMSYSRLYKPYDWVISTGVYLDDVDNLIASESRRMIQTNRRTIRQIGMTIFVSVLILAVFIILFEFKLQKVISEYFTSLQDSKDQLQYAYDKIKEMAYTDHLTGLLNRRAMYDHLDDERSRFLRTGNTFSLLLGDIDWFKSINDTHGHDAGDFVIKELARIIQENLRKEDKASRWGGEEYLCLITNSGPEEAFVVAEKIRKAVESHDFIYGELNLSITLTLGVSSATKELSVNQLIEKADKNLYLGKKKGRNIVMG